MAADKFSTNIDKLTQADFDAVRKGIVRDESADTVINNLGAALAEQKNKVKSPVDAGRIFEEVSGSSFCGLSPFFYDLFVKMYKNDRPAMTLGVSSVFPSSLTLNDAQALAVRAQEYGYVMSEISYDALVVIPTKRLLEVLAEKGWDAPRYKRPLTNPVEKAAATPRPKR